MADNIDVTPGTGKTVATTEVGGAQFQNVIIADGTGAEVDFTAPVEVIGTGSAGAPSPSVVTIQGIASGTNVAVAGSGTAASPSGGVITIQGLQADDAALGATATNPVPIGGKFNNSPPTYADGDRVQAQFDSKGNIKTAIYGANSNTSAVVQTFSDGSTFPGQAVVYSFAMGGVYSGTSGTYDRMRSIAASFGAATGILAVEQAGSSKTNITTATTTQVKSGTGILHSIVVNTAVSAATISIYDATSGTTNPIGVITCPATAAPFRMEYNCDVATGIRVITSAATDITVVYR